MIHWNSLKSAEKISYWRNFRLEMQQKTDLSDLELFTEVTNFFGSIPRDSRSIDYYTPESWPNPWEILYHSFSCDSAISLLNYYTIILIRPNLINHCSMFLIDSGLNEFLIPLFNKQYLMNYDYTHVVDINSVKQDIKIIKKFTKEDLPKIQ
jgi:hypothetical protein